jgi:GTP cyclohydrolase II
LVYYFWVCYFGAGLKGIGNDRELPRNDIVLSRRPAITPLRDARVLRQIDGAVTELRRGGFVLLREPELVLLVQAAEAVSADTLARVRALSGEPVSLVLTRRRAAALGLAEPPREPGGAMLLRVAGDAAAATLRDLADPGAKATAPLPLESATPAMGAADAAVELMKLARLLPAAVVARVRAGDVLSLVEREKFLLLDAADIRTYQATAARSLRPVSEARVPLVDAESTRIIAFRPSDGGIEHLAILIGDPDGSGDVLVRLHSECFTGDLLGSLRCDCGDQLRGAIAEIARAGSGVLLYLAQEGRGIGLVNKLRAYQLQDDGFDTVDANEQLGFDADERVYLPAAEMLRQLGFERVRLLTNNPEKMAALTRCGITVTERVPHVFPANGHNERYLRTKATRSGHWL